MSDHQCGACDNPAPSGVTLCGRCEQETRTRLQHQETYRRELLTVLARMTRTQAPNDGGRAANLTLAWAQMGDRFLDTIDGKELRRLLASLPPAWRAASVLRGQRALLLEWCRTLFPDTHSEASVSTLACVLLDHLPIIRKQDCAGDYTTRIAALTARILQVIDLPTERTRIPVGPCPNSTPNDHGYDEPCPGAITAHFPQDTATPATMRCSTCKAEWPTDQWNRAGTLIQRRMEQLERQKQLAQQFIGKAGR